MALSAAVMFSSVAPARDTAPPAVGESEAPAAAAAEAGAQGESFDALMNFLLGAVSPAEPAALAPAEGSLPASPLETAAAAVDATADVVADHAAIAACLPDPPAVETLPPGGKVLPSAAQEPDADAAGDALSLLPQAPTVAAPPSAPALDAAGAAGDPATDGSAVAGTPLSPAAEAALAAPVRGAEPSIPVDAAAAGQTVSTPAAPPPATPVVSAAAPAASTPASTPAPAAASSPAAVEPAVRDAAAARPEAITRAEPALPPRADAGLPLPSDFGSGQQAATQDGDTRGQARLQELLARLGGTDGAARAPGEAFRNLLQGAEGGAPGNAAALTYAQTGTAGPVRDPAVPNLPVHTPLRHPEWSDEVSQRIRWAIGNQVQSAELKINPPQLGPVEVRVSVDADKQMTVTLSSQHVLVRETLQESLPRLRDLMSEHGFGAVNVDVSQHSSSDDRKPSAQAEPDPAARAAVEAGAVADAGAAPPGDVRGLVDLYA